jgi:hypothetical protein
MRNRAERTVVRVLSPVLRLRSPPILLGAPEVRVSEGEGTGGYCGGIDPTFPESLRETGDGGGVEGLQGLAAGLDAYQFEDFALQVSQPAGGQPTGFAGVGEKLIDVRFFGENRRGPIDDQLAGARERSGSSRIHAAVSRGVHGSSQTAAYAAVRAWRATR